MKQLPDNWCEAKLEEVVLSKKGNKPDDLNEVEFENSVPYIDIKAFEKNIIERYAPINKSKLTQKGNLLVVWDGARSGLTGLSKYQGAIGSTLVDLTTIIINSEYLFRFLQTQYDYINSHPRGTGIPHVDPAIFWKIDVPLAPLNEQKRIVAKLEKLLPRVESAKERLNKIPAILKRFRQSVLAQACSGELTKDWREKNPGVESAEELLKKIQIEINQLIKQKLIQKENSQVIIEKNQLTPENWIPLKARFLCHHITKGTTPKQMTEEGDIPYLKVYNIIDNKIDFKYKPQFVSKDIHNKFLARSKVYPNDVLMNIVGPPLGKIAIIPTDYPEWNINQALAIFRPIKYLLPEFLYIVLSYDKTISNVLPDTKGIVGQSNISLEQCRDLIISIPSLEEQKEIVKRVKKLFAYADKLEARCQSAKKFVDKLDQSILNKAFKGELVPQDPNDEPASVLLEKIRAEKEKIEGGKAKKRSREKVTASK